jgi:MFS family permease
LQSIGGICALPFAAYLCDGIGRRKTIFLGSVIMLVGVAIQTAAQNIGMFIGARGLIGFGLGFACAAAPLLITELSFPTHRGPLTSLYNSSWYLGSIVAAWVRMTRVSGTSPISSTNHLCLLGHLRDVQDCQQLVVANPLDFAGIAQCFPGGFRISPFRRDIADSRF